MRFLLLFILTDVFGFARGQFYLDRTSTWSFVGEISFTGIQGQYEDYSDVQYFDGDTVIASNKYYKVYENHYELSYPGNGPPTLDSFNHGFIAVLREDSNIFYTYSDSDYPIVNFNLALNSPLPKLAYCNLDSAFYVKAFITRIDTFYLGNELRRVFFLDSTFGGDGAYIMEGIGGWMGLPTYSWWCVYEGYPEFPEPLTSFCQDGYGISTSLNNLGDTFSCPVLILNSITSLSVSGNFQVYPNPTNTIWRVNVNDELIGSTLEIFDTNGKLVYQNQIKNQEFEISPDIGAGVYFMRIKSQQYSSIKKLVKTIASP